MFRFSRKTSYHEILWLSRVATAKKSDQKACVIMHVQSNVLLVKSFDFARTPCYETNRTDISFLFTASYIITCKVISFKLVLQFLTV